MLEEKFESGEWVHGDDRWEGRFEVDGDEKHLRQRDGEGEKTKLKKFKERTKRR